jgi:hypothetical protein
VRLGPLPVPPPGASAADAQDTPAVAAFVAHVQRRDPSFGLDEVTLTAAADVARRLDGLPLALELAAGRVATLGIVDVRERLGRALDLFGGGRTTGDARHRTLRSTIDWSYRLLDEDEQALLRAMAVFPSGLDLGGVERLVAGGAARDPAATVARLVDASVVTTDTTLGRTRYRLLETIRAFAAEEAAARGELADAEDALVANVLELVRELWEIGRGPRERDANDRLAIELANIRAARDVAVARDDLDAILAISIGLHDVGSYRAFAEVRTWAVDGGLRALAAPQHPEAARALGAAARAAWMRGELDRCEQLARRGIELASDERQRESCYDALGVAAIFRGDMATCERLQLKAAAASAGAWRGSYISTAALAATYAGDEARAEQLLTRAYEECARNGSISEYAFTRYAEGELRSRQHPQRALAVYEDAIAEARSVGASFAEGVATVGLVSTWARLGRTREALEGYRWLIGYWRRAGNWTQLWTTLRNLATLLAGTGDAECAALLLAAAQHAEGAAYLDDATQAQLAQLRDQLRQRLGDHEADRVEARARSLARGVVVDQALVAVDAALR